MSIQHRVWIELEAPASEEEGDHRAAQLSKMLKRLGVPYPQPVFWHQAKGHYCFTTSEAHTFVEAGDSGHWYNLDFLAGE